MAFCNSCGANLGAGSKFCNNCGAAVTGATVANAPVPAATATPAPKNTSALKIILIVVAVIVCLGIVGVATVGFVAYRFAKDSHVTQQGDSVKVETPFGTVSTNDPDQAVKDLGVDVYPGAEVQKSGASSATIAGMRTITANFESADSVDKVCAFYREKFPRSNVSSSDQNHCTIVSNDPKNTITINIETHGDGSKFHIANVSRKASTSD
jgi:flagellar basal body-associated protein FliL